MLPAPNSKLQFTVVREVDADAATVFTVLTSEVGMKSWIPLCRSAQWRLARGAILGVGAVRYIVLHGGIVAAERIVAWQAGSELQYTFDESSLPLTRLTRNYVGVTRVESLRPGRTRLTWAIHFDAPGRLQLLEPMLRGGLKMFIGMMASKAAHQSELTSRY